MGDESNWKRWLFCVPLLMVPANVHAGTPSAELVKATYILQMQKFVTVDGHPPGKVCYYERQGVPLEESVGQLIEKYVAEHTGDHMPAVKHLDAVRDFKGCDIFYIPEDEEGNIDNILAALGAADTLTISASKRFILRGGMIGFVIDENNRIRMEANLKNLKGKNLRIDASLLEIMMKVIHD